MPRDRDPGFAHARNLVAQGSRTDAELLGCELATTASLFQGTEYQTSFVVLEVGTECLTLSVVRAAPLQVAIGGR